MHIEFEASHMKRMKGRKKSDLGVVAYAYNPKIPA